MKTIWIWKLIGVYFLFNTIRVSFEGEGSLKKINFNPIVPEAEIKVYFFNQKYIEVVCFSICLTLK